MLSEVRVKDRDYLPLILSLTSRYWRWDSSSASVTFEDAVSESVLALLTQAGRHSSKRTKLITYAYRRIAGATQDLARIELKYAARFAPCAPEDLPQVQDTASFEEELGFRLLYQKTLRTMLRILPSTEVLVLTRFYLQGRTEQMIADEFDLRRHHIPMLRKSALEKLRAAMPDVTL